MDMPRVKKAAKKVNPEPTQEQLQKRLEELRDKRKPLEVEKREHDKKMDEIEKQISETKQKMKSMKVKVIMEHIDVLLMLVSEHDFTSCSDNNFCNSDRGCTRCFLLESKKYDSFDNEYELNISIERC